MLGEGVEAIAYHAPGAVTTSSSNRFAWLNQQRRVVHRDDSADMESVPLERTIITFLGCCFNGKLRLTWGL